MRRSLIVELNPTVDQAATLRDLQAAFAAVCNELSPIVQATRCWNRVALHHMTYRAMREKFPSLGSQLICNAIYAVCRAARLLYQTPGSPFNLSNFGPQSMLPAIRFAPSAPVYFDRHTLSLKPGSLSLLTLAGRMRFDVKVTPEQQQQFMTHKLVETLMRTDNGQFRLNFILDDGSALHPGSAHPSPGAPDDEDADARQPAGAGLLPDYLFIQTPAQPAAGLSTS